MKQHKCSAVCMIISMIVCIVSAHKKSWKLHHLSAAVMAVSALICVCTGHGMVKKHTAKPEVKDADSEADEADPKVAEPAADDMMNEEAAGDAAANPEGQAEDAEAAGPEDEDAAEANAQAAGPEDGDDVN